MWAAEGIASACSTTFGRSTTTAVSWSAGTAATAADAVDASASATVAEILRMRIADAVKGSVVVERCWTGAVSESESHERRLCFAKQ
jgi:hypothetical protein